MVSKLFSKKIFEIQKKHIIQIKSLDKKVLVVFAEENLFIDDNKIENPYNLFDMMSRMSLPADLRNINRYGTVYTDSYMNRYKLTRRTHERAICKNL